MYCLDLKDYNINDKIIVRYNHSFGGGNLWPKRVKELESVGYITEKKDDYLKLTGPQNPLIIEDIPELFRPGNPCSQTTIPIKLESIIHIEKLTEQNKEQQK
ncbi:MAG: hypothetical protein ABIC91_07790 [Nanoarchaeota archaeon]|nr:hypothetical protein [Nanoarchaeota archaeon]MBU1031253.1 hypothetical protein [Nanoarchaeota archaeon]MBU1849594.1 hypothetical protein [Nanoarchaeota archaeon]